MTDDGLWVGPMLVAQQDYDAQSTRRSLKDRVPSRLDQPSPRASDGMVVHDLVVADLAERASVGLERYGTPLRAHNGRDALVDAYQEALDLVMYLRQALAERDGR